MVCVIVCSWRGCPATSPPCPLPSSLPHFEQQGSSKAPPTQTLTQPTHTDQAPSLATGAACDRPKPPSTPASGPLIRRCGTAKKKHPEGSTRTNLCVIVGHALQIWRGHAVHGAEVAHQRVPRTLRVAVVVLPGEQQSGVVARGDNILTQLRASSTGEGGAPGTTGNAVWCGCKRGQL